MKHLLQSVSIILIVNIFIACESHEKKVDDAFDHVKEQKSIYKDTVKVFIKAENTAPRKSVIVVKNESKDALTAFNIETESKIRESENEISQLKLKRNTTENKNKFDRQVTRLELNNNKLRKRMNDYNEENKVRWEKYKTGITHDIDAIRIELKDVTINNKKKIK